MTAVLQNRVPRVLVHPIYSQPDGVPYLVMELHADGSGALIRKSSRFKSKLGSYWKVWARDWLLKLDCKYGLKIVIQSRGVSFRADRPYEDWIWAAESLLANVTLLADAPMWPYRWRGRVDAGYWRVHPCADLTDIIKNVELPKGAQPFFELTGGIRAVHIKRYGIEREKCPFPIEEIRRIVELQVALACHHDGVPVNFYEIYRRLMRADMKVFAKTIGKQELPMLMRDEFIQDWYARHPHAPRYIGGPGGSHYVAPPGV